MTDVSQILQRFLPADAGMRDTAIAFAPANIALCKYWGKRNEPLKLPLTGSLSVSLGQHGTRMHLSRAESDSLTINENPFAPHDKASRRLFDFLDLLRPKNTPLRVDSINTIPMAAGVASSAAAFAAVVLAMDQLCGWQLDPQHLSILARIGSGSAARSVSHGFMEWQAGINADGMDSYAVHVAPVWPDFRVGIVTVSSSEKSVGSSEGMRRTRDTATLYRAWPDQVAEDLPAIRQAVLSRDFTQLGERAEQNAMAMHATMLAARPPILYWHPNTVATLNRVWACRQQGLEVYATMDAGPNVKLLFLQKDTPGIQEAFPTVDIVNPSEMPGDGGRDNGNSQTSSSIT